MEQYDRLLERIMKDRNISKMEAIKIINKCIHLTASKINPRFEDDKNLLDVCSVVLSYPKSPSVHFLRLLEKVKDDGYSIYEACSKINSSYRAAAKDAPLWLFDILKEPANEEKTSIVSGRVKVFRSNKGNYIVKNDEKSNANALSFITAAIASFLKIPTPDSILVLSTPSMHSENGLQIIEYLDWEDLRVRKLYKLNSNDIGRHIGMHMAFCAVLGCGDQFLYMSRLFDNVIYAKDPEYEEMNPVAYPMINNFGIVDGKMYITDASPSYTISKLSVIRKMIKDQNFLKQLFRITTQYFELNAKEEEEMKNSFVLHTEKFATFSPYFDSFLVWAGLVY